MNDAVVPTHAPELTLSSLYRDHRSWLENWLRRRLGNAWDAADLSQDTFLRVLASAQPIAQMQEPRAYLVTVGKRLLVNFHQRRSVEQAYLNALASLPEACVPSPEQRWLVLAVAVMSAVLLGLMQVMPAWDHGNMLERFIRLGGLVVAGVLAYFGMLLLLGLRLKDFARKSLM